MFRRKTGGHYAARKSEQYSIYWKVVIAYTDGSSYDDIGTNELYTSFDEANRFANAMNKARLGKLDE